MNTDIVSNPIFFLVVSLIGIGIIVLEFNILSYLVYTFKLSEKYKKPKEVLTLLAIELVTLLLTIKDIQGNYVLLGMTSLFLGIKVIGLWGLRKWIIYFYAFAAFLSWSYTYMNLNAEERLNNSSIIIFGFIGSFMVLLFYYYRVFVPNKSKFI